VVGGRGQSLIDRLRRANASARGPAIRAGDEPTRRLIIIPGVAIWNEPVWCSGASVLASLQGMSGGGGLQESRSTNAGSA
jgi:hypothetical protein